ncbi:MAG: TIGR00374 family protein [Balneola sp.]|nr:TIGR00374 family protein [Balneola sp.]|tara:strand:- start:323 stop:1345 length:1023 start_codon:yes stop_codon:yes gene_type:complete
MNKSVKYIVGIIFAAFFLWLSFSDVSFEELRKATKDISWSWLIPFSMALTFSHYIRAERWRLLLGETTLHAHRTTLFAGVMFGYLINIPFPRLGEISRPMYVAKQLGESNSKLVGTIVIERLIDVISMFIIMGLVAYFLLSDVDTLSRLFGIDLANSQVYSALFLNMWPLILLGIGLIFLGWVIFKRLNNTSYKSIWLFKTKEIIAHFVEGLLSIKKLQQPLLFVGYTVIIWIGYIAMMYIPLWMFDLPLRFDLGWADAAILTMASAIALSIPSPGGIGSYHYFISYSLGILYTIPEPTGLAFATITHAATMAMVILIAPAALAMDKFLLLQRESTASNV